MENEQYPYATVGGLIFAQDGKILLVESKKWLNCLSVPGGKVELGETREQAFVREVQEETSLKVDNIRYAYAQDSIYNPQFWQKKHFIMHQFICDLAPGVRKEDVVLNDEAHAYQWVSLEKALTMLLNTETYPLVKWAVAEKGQRGLIGFDNHKILCVIGHEPQEWQREQEIYIDLRVQACFVKSAKTGHLADTVDYVFLAALCTQLAQAKKYHLMESFAVDVLQKVLDDPHIFWAWIRIKKPEALLSAEYTLVELERGQKWVGR